MIKKVLVIVFCLLVITLKVYANNSDVNLYFENKTGVFIPKLYFHHSNQVFYFLKSKGGKDLPIENLSFEIEEGNVFDRKNRKCLTIYPSNKDSLKVTVKYNSQIIKEQYFKVVPLPPPELDLYYDLKGTKLVNLKQPVPLVDTLFLKLKYEKDYDIICRYSHPIYNVDY